MNPSQDPDSPALPASRCCETTPRPLEYTAVVPYVCRVSRHLRQKSPFRITACSPDPSLVLDDGVCRLALTAFSTVFCYTKYCSRYTPRVCQILQSLQSIENMATHQDKHVSTIKTPVCADIFPERKASTNMVQTRVHKKYLGEADDPHYMPTSPIISRQHLTQQEEGELIQSCVLALSGVPHSDDATDDPLAGMAAILAMQKLPTQEATKSKVTRAENGRIRLPEVPPIPASNDTATPSDSSKRDTFSRTDYSTPMTSAGVTPGESSKRFSDAVRRMSTARSAGATKLDQRPKSRESKHRATSKTRPHVRESDDTPETRSQERKVSTEKKQKSKIRLVMDKTWTKTQSSRDVPDENGQSTQSPQDSVETRGPKPQPLQVVPEKTKSTTNSPQAVFHRTKPKKETSKAVPEKTKAMTQSPQAALEKPIPETQPAAAVVKKTRRKTQPSQKAPPILQFTAKFSKSSSAPPKPFRYSQIELNKSLPTLPPVDPDPIKIEPLRDISMSLSETVKKKRSQLSEKEQRTITTSEESSPLLPHDAPGMAGARAKTLSMPLDRPQQPPNAPPAPPTERRHRLKAYFFTSKRLQAQQEVLVS